MGLNIGRAAAAPGPRRGPKTAADLASRLAEEERIRLAAEKTRAERGRKLAAALVAQQAKAKAEQAAAKRPATVEGVIRATIWQAKKQSPGISDADLDRIVSRAVAEFERRGAGR